MAYAPKVQSQECMDECKAILASQAAMESERSNWEGTWEECYQNITPRKGQIQGESLSGEKRGHDLFDTTAIMSNMLLGGALHSMLTSAAVRFFDLIPDDISLYDDSEVREWLVIVADKMYSVFNGSNFQTEVHELYQDLTAIGTGCFYAAEHDKSVVHFSARAMKEIYCGENNLGLIDIVHRKFKWKLRQIVQEFGEDSLPENLHKKYTDGCEDFFDIIHRTAPGDKEKTGYHPFVSKYVLKEGGHLLHEGGFKEFPYMVPRWTKTSGEVYGRGPGQDMLPDIKMVNIMMRTVLKGAQKTVDPPLMVMDDGVIGNVRLTPGGLTLVRPGLEQPIRPLITDARIDFGYQAVEDVRKRIRAGFYVDQLMLNEGPQMTATEVNQRTEEKLRLMGPVLGRQHFEFLRPLIDRVFGIMVRKGLIPEAPQKIKGKPFGVRYSSLIARAQRMSEGQNMTRALQVASPLVNAVPATLDLLDSDKAFKKIMSDYALDSLIKSDRAVQQVRDSRAEAQQRLAQEQQQQHAADIASKAGPAAAQLIQAQAAERTSA